MLRFLSRKTKKINHKDEYGNTALHYAVIDKNPRMVYNLLLASSSISIKNNNGLTPIDIAKMDKNESVMSLFVRLKEFNKFIESHFQF